MLYQPTNITPSSLNGTGIIDHEKDVVVSWQLGGEPSDRLTGWRIIIMQNDDASTVVYDSGIQRFPSEGGIYSSYPAWDNFTNNWRTVSWTIPAGSLSGMSYLYDKGYKMRVNQLTEVWDEETRQYSSDIEIEHISPVFIRSARVPILMDWQYEDTVPTHNIFFYTDFSTPRDYYWDDNVMICPYPRAKYSRAMLAHESTDNVIYDSGWRLNPGNSQLVYDGIVDGETYYAKLFLTDTNGFTLDTGWQMFTGEYNYVATSGTLTAYYVPGKPCTYLKLTGAPDIRWAIYRVPFGGGVMEPVCILEQGQTEFYDYGLKNRVRYTYHAFRQNTYNYGEGTEHLESNEICMERYFDWAILETEPADVTVGGGVHIGQLPQYHVVKTHIFQGNVDSGEITNSAGPDIQENFTGYPMVQKNLRKALSGKLKAVVGRVTNAAFSDSTKEIDAIFAMSQNQTVKFLRDRKGYLHKIEIGGAISRKYNDKNAEQSTTVTVPWVEVGSADGCRIGIWQTDGSYPQDAIWDTETAIDGDSIKWTYGEGYRNGSWLSMDENGYLVQTYDADGWNPADLAIRNGKLVVSTGE